MQTTLTGPHPVHLPVPLPAPAGTAVRRARACAAYALSAALVLGAGCPGSQGGAGRPRAPAAELLAADAEALTREAPRAGLPEAPGLVEAYLLHHRGTSDAARASLCAWLSKSGLGAATVAARLSSLPVTGKDRLRSFVAALLALPPCDGAARAPGATPPSTFQPGLFASTVTREAEGHRATTQETWLLAQGAEEISGWVLRSVTQLSSDGRRFVCSKDVRTLTHAAYFVTGRLEDGRLTLQSTAAYADPGPCAPDRLPALHCTGQPTSQGLRMACPEDLSLARKADLPPPGDRQVFAWNGVTPRAQGGRDEVSETWHLASAGDVLRGFYLRETQAKALPGRTFPCNGAASFVTQRLFLLTGTRTAAGVSLVEVAALRAPGACDRDPITLDRYAGKREGDSLTLRYGEGAAAGSQTLVLVKGAPSLAPSLPWPELK